MYSWSAWLPRWPTTTGPTLLGPTQHRHPCKDPAHGQRHRHGLHRRQFHSVGQQFAGRRITLRLETTLAHVILDGVLTRTIPLTPTQRARLQDARMPGPAPLIDQRPTRVQRTVSCRGGTQIIGQRVQVGLRYAGQIVTIEVDETTLHVYDQRDHLIKTVPRTSRKEVRRRKAYGHTTNQKTG